MPDRSVIIIGGGHNGLVCACYLAKAGHKVQVLERRDVVGGCAVTEEFHPGFRNSVASYTVSLLNPTVTRDLKLHDHGLKILTRPMANFLPLPDGNCLKWGGDLKQRAAEVSRFSRKDTERLPEYEAKLDVAADVLRSFVLKAPVDRKGVGGLLKMLQLAIQVGNLDRATQTELFLMMTRSAGDLLDGFFETNVLKALFAFDSVVGNFASPYMPGTAYVLLHHVFGEVNGQKGQWGHAVGGMGSITQAMAREAEARGVELTTGAEVSRVHIDEKGVREIELSDGRTLKADIVVANVNPKLLFTQMVEADALEASFRERMENYRCASGTFRMNVALSELPVFTCSPGEGLHHSAGIIINPSLRYMEEAYFDARTRGYSRKPIVEMLIPSTVDDSLAPKGAHVASLFCQHFNPELPDGRSWDDVREEAADTVIDTVNEYAPNFKQSVIGRQILSPLDLERVFGLTGGDIFHGAMTLDQLYAARPTPGCGSYRTPVKGLYLCGSGTHPGGGVTGAPGHNAAREIIKDLG